MKHKKKNKEKIIYLTDFQFQILLLYYQNDLSIEEISFYLNVKKSFIYSILDKIESA